MAKLDASVSITTSLDSSLPSTSEFAMSCFNEQIERDLPAREFDVRF